MVDYKNSHSDTPENENKTECQNTHACCCRCCHCKKIFMLIVILLLCFMAGIMVGRCNGCCYTHAYMHKTYKNVPAHHQIKKQKLQRGMHQIQPETGLAPVQPAPLPPYPDGAAGGFMIEVAPGY